MLEVHDPTPDSLRCPTCILAFVGVHEHKTHYKSDLHRYNLKRKMVRLAPVTQQQFQQKKINEISNVTVQQDLKCPQCLKKFASLQTLKQHLHSKKHNINHTHIPKQTDHRVPEKFVVNSSVCLFCCAQSSTLDSNLEHMSLIHSFFIPQQQFCVRRKQLIEYLQEKIEVGCMCITCDNKGVKDFHSGGAVRKHMLDKGHTFMKTEHGYEEYQSYYDFCRQFQQLLDSQEGLTVPGISYEKVRVYEHEEQPQPSDNAEHEQSADQWEDEESGDESDWQSASDDSSYEQPQPQQQQNSKKPAGIKTYYIMKPTLTGNEQLLLPNGKILGNRKYRHLYQQNYRQPSLMMRNIRALGYGNGPQGLSNTLERRRIPETIKADQLLRTTRTRRTKNHLKNGMQNNLLMKFFRCQNSL